jgi:hypothetical protein
MIKYDKIFFFLITVIVLQLFLFGCDSSGSAGILTDNFFGDENVQNPTIPEEKNFEPASITGYIFDINTNEPISGALIKLENYITTYTDINGFFRISNIVSTTSTDILEKNLLVSAPTYNSITEPVSLPSGSTTNTIYKLSRKTGTVSGLLKEGIDSIPGAVITVGGKNTITNRNGYFSFENLPVGINDIKVYVNNVLRMSSMIEIIENYQNININLDNSHGDILEVSTIYGVIRDSQSNSLISDIIVSVSGYPSAISGTSTTGDGNNDTLKGFYFLNNIPTGKRVVTFIDPSGNYYDYSVTLDLLKGENNFDVTLTPRPHHMNETSNITGIVTARTNGLLLNGIEIRLRLYDAQTSNYIAFSVISENDGWFSFSDIPQGRYILTAVDTRNPKRYADFHQTDLVIEDGTQYMSILMRQF